MKTYKIKGQDYDRVTRIIGILDKPALNRWLASVGIKEANRIMKEAQEFGSEVHRGIECSLKGQKFHIKEELKDKEEEIQNNRKLGLHYLKHHRLTPISSEKLIYSHKYKYAGTTDLICRNDLKELVMLDWKNSKAIYNTALIQLSAYNQAYKEMTGDKISKLIVVNLGKGYYKKPSVKEADPTYFSYFVDCLKLYRGLYK